MVYSTWRFVLSLALCYFVLVFSCVFQAFLEMRLPRLGKRKLILVLFVRLFDLHLFGFVCFFFLLGLGSTAACNCGTPGTFFLHFCL